MAMWVIVCRHYMACNTCAPVDPSFATPWLADVRSASRRPYIWRSGLDRNRRPVELGEREAVERLVIATLGFPQNADGDVFSKFQ